MGGERELKEEVAHDIYSGRPTRRVDWRPWTSGTKNKAIE